MWYGLPDRIVSIRMYVSMQYVEDSLALIEMNG